MLSYGVATNSLGKFCAIKDKEINNQLLNENLHKDYCCTLGDLGQQPIVKDLELHKSLLLYSKMRKKECLATSILGIVGTVIASRPFIQFLKKLNKHFIRV